MLAPLGTNGTLTVNVQSAGLSLLMPTVTVYDALQQPLGSASGAGQYGSTLSVSVEGVAPLQLFTIKVAPAETSAFGTGRYALTLNFGDGPSPEVPLPDTRVLNSASTRQGAQAVGASAQDGFAVIWNGLPMTEMKGVKEAMQERDVWNVVNYIRSIGPKPAAATK